MRQRARPGFRRDVVETMPSATWTLLAVPRAMAVAFGADFSLLLVVEPPVTIADPTGLTVLPASVEAEKWWRQRAADYLAAVAGKLEAEGVAVTSNVVDGPGVASVVLAQVEPRGIDLVVIASHGAGGFERLVVGSVADKVIRGAWVPVLVVRTDKAHALTAGEPREPSTP